MSLQDHGPTTRFFVTQPQPCPYLAGRVEQKVVTVLGHAATAGKYDLLNRNGFRRSHEILYRPTCPACQACVPVRVVVASFAPSRSLRRITHRNAGLIATEGPALATAEQYDLFHRYQRQRHGDGDMALMTSDDYRDLIEESPVETQIIEFRDSGGTLVAAGLVDCLSDGLSAIYLFFDPTLEANSLGTHLIVWMIEETRRRGLEYLYLGYWIAESPKMSYKARFQPLEALGHAGWLPWPPENQGRTPALGPESARAAPVT